jgi:hypothetical protein
MANDPVEGERRKILARSLPFVLNAAWEAHSVLSPGRLASTAISEFQKVEENEKIKEAEIATLVRDIGHLNLKSEEDGSLSLTLTRSEILELIGNYLVSQFLKEGSIGTRFEVSSNFPNYDGVLSLPNKAVFAKLVEMKIDQKWIFDEADRAQEVNPSEVWVFVYDNERFDIRFDPVFISENRTMRGRFKLFPVTEVIDSVTKGKFGATIDSSAERENEQTRFVLRRVGSQVSVR